MIKEKNYISKNINNHVLTGGDKGNTQMAKTCQGYSKKNVLGIDFNDIILAEVLDNIQKNIAERQCGYIVTPNVDHIILFQKDTQYQEICRGATLILADGMPVIWASKLLGAPLPEKISGSDLAPILCELSARKGYKMFFLGGRTGAALRAKKNLEMRYPGIQIVGTYSPPIGFENDTDEKQKIIDMINCAEPDLLLVGLGTPKQEKWIKQHYRMLTVPICIGVGATFEFLAEIVKRAPIWMQRSGLEWFWRLLMEPKRLWKRYLINDMQFIWLLLKEKSKHLLT